MALGIKVGLGQGHIVLDEDPAPLPRKGQSPQLSAHFYCGQATACIKMPLGIEVGLSSGDFVLDGDPAPSPKMGGAPNFRPMSILAKRLHGSRCHLVRRYRGLHDIVLDGDPASPSLKVHSPLPHFSANVRCGQTAGWTKMPLGMEVGLGPGDFMFDGDPATTRKMGTPTPPCFWLMSVVAKRLDGSRCHLVRR